MRDVEQIIKEIRQQISNGNYLIEDKLQEIEQINEDRKRKNINLQITVASLTQAITNANDFR